MAAANVLLKQIYENTELKAKKQAGKTCRTRFGPESRPGSVGSVGYGSGSSFSRPDGSGTDLDPRLENGSGSGSIQTRSRSNPLPSLLKSNDKFADETLFWKMWWDHISEMFLRIFRDVARGLMFLHEKTHYVCGELSFNTFVTVGGRGRILPSLDKSKKGVEDVTQFFHLLKNIVYFPFMDKSTPAIALPSDLSKLLNFIPCIRILPAYVVVNHPFFWTVQEKIDFAVKCQKLVKKDKQTEATFQDHLHDRGIFFKWWIGLKGVYRALWKTAERKRDMARYEREVHIVRFFNAAYSHVNDRSYKRIRKGKIFTDVQIESDLMAYFPNYYVAIFECLCDSINAALIVDTAVLEEFYDILPS